MLPGAAVSQLEDHLSRLYRQSGIDIRFVILDRVAGETMQDFALQRARDLGIGPDSDRRRVLVVYEPLRGQLRVEVSPALDGIFPDRFASYLMRDGQPADFSGGWLTSDLRFTLLTLHARLRRAALGQEYDPLAAEYIEERQGEAELRTT